MLAAASACVAWWSTIAGSIAATHGLKQRGASHARTSRVTTITRSHAAERCCPELEPPSYASPTVLVAWSQPAAAGICGDEAAYGTFR